MHDRMTNLRTLRRKTSVTVKAHYQLSDGSTQVIIFDNSYKTRREQLDEYEDWGRRTDLKLVQLYWCPERFVQHDLKWCDYDRYQEELNFEATDLKRGPRQLKDLTIFDGGCSEGC